MPDSPATFTPFEHFGTTFSQTNSLIAAFAKFYKVKTSDTNLEVETAKVRRLIEGSTKADSKPRKFWDDALSSVIAWKKGEKLENEGGYDIDMGLLPFTQAVELADREDLDKLMGTWWSANGSASKEEHRLPIPPPPSESGHSQGSSHPSSAASSRRSSRSCSSAARSRSAVSEGVNNEIESEADAASSAREESPVIIPPFVAPPRHRSSSRRSSSRQRDPSESIEPYTFNGQARGPSAPLRRQPSRSRKAASLASVASAAQSSLSQLSSEGDSDFKADNARILNELRAASSINVPPGFEEAYKKMEKYRTTSNESIVKNLAKAAHTVRMPLKTKMSTIRNDYVNFEEINGFDASASTSHRLYGMEDGTITSEPSTNTKKITTYQIWADCNEIWRKFSRTFYPALYADRKWYANWMRNENRLSPDKWAAYRAFDVFVRTNIGTESYPHTLQGFTNQTTILLRFLTDQSLSSSSPFDNSTFSLSPQKRLRPSDDPSTQICKRFNDKSCPGNPGCGGRIHECENCGGDHAGMDCSVHRTVTTERHARKKAYEARQLLMAGNSGGAGNSGNGGNRGPATA